MAATLLLLITVREKKRRLNTAYYREQWQKIVALLKVEESYNLAVIEADKLLDQAFKERGFKGQTMAERLTIAGFLLSAKNEVWQVHKLRNRLVHEVDVQLTLKQARSALKGLSSGPQRCGGFLK